MLRRRTLLARKEVNRFFGVSSAESSTTPILKPNLKLMAFGMPLALDKAQFTNFASKTIDFVKNTGGAANKVNKHYFIIGDYLASPGKFAYCDPNPQGSEAGASWLITEWLNKLPDGVEAGLEIWMDPGDALTLDNPNKQPADKSKYNYKGNVIIGDGSAGFPKDNARQVFEYIKSINDYQAANGGKQITTFHFDHEGGGDYQNDSYTDPVTKELIPSTYGGTNGDRIGIGYLKWLWNEFMPKQTVGGKTIAWTHDQAKQDSFKGHYQLGWTNYRVEAYAENSSGTIDNHAENYWFGELEYEPIKWDKDNPNQKWPVASVFAPDPNQPGKLHLDRTASYKLDTISEARGITPEDTFDDAGHIIAGGNTLDWEGINQNGVHVISPQAINSVYRYYRNYPEKLAYMFSDARYNDLYQPGEKGDKAWGPPLLPDPKNPRQDDLYYTPRDPNGPTNDKLYKQPAGGIPTFSFENLSSTNQGRVTQAADSKMPNFTPSDSIISAVALPSQLLDINKYGGTFDGLSALDYSDFIRFLNATAEAIASVSDDIDPTDVTIALYESTFLPDAWVNKTWVQGTLIEGTDTADTLQGGSGIQTITARGGNDTLIGGADRDLLSGSSGADKFQYNNLDDSRPGEKRDVITDFNGEEGDRIDFSNMPTARTYVGSAGFSGSRGEVRFEDGILQLNTDRDQNSDMEIELAGVTTFSSDYLILPLHYAYM